jgi:hypothetical protein
LVDGINCFNNCTFRNGDGGLANGALLSINNDQDFTINNASFPTSGTDYNVAKLADQGQITFVDYSGVFSGEDYDYDPNDRIDWFTPQLSASPTTINVLPPAGSTSFQINSNVDWTITESISWLTVNPMSGSNNKLIIVDYTENPFIVSRTGTITISAPDVPNVTVTIIQAGNQLTVTTPERNVSAAAGSTTFTVTSNTNWTVTAGFPWLSVDPPAGFGNGVITVT